MTPTVLLTGGFGNIGGRLTDDLITHGDVEIRLASRVAQPPPIWAPNADVVLLDLLDESTIHRAVTGINTIFHLAALNDIAAPYRIYVNQSLRLKGSVSQRTTSTQAITQATPIQRQTINLPTQQPVVPKTPVITPTPVNSPTASTLASGLRWVKPSNGPVIQGFNLASNVKGTRYGGNEGDPVYAAANGQVVYAADGLKEYGNLVLIKHIDGYITAYAHNSKMLVKSGDNVTAGQKIAEMGSTGATRVMLEFQVRLDGKPVNPTTVLPN